jgi:hypothetical protein
VLGAGVLGQVASAAGRGGGGGPEWGGRGCSANLHSPPPPYPQLPGTGRPLQTSDVSPKPNS